jgi:uncharacterized protein (DUF433 family)
MTATSAPRDRRDEPDYPLPEASRWLGIAPARLRSWLVGRPDPSRPGERLVDPLLTPALTEPLTLSFWNLVECSVLAAIRDEHGASLREVRTALRTVTREIGQQRPLIEQDFSTDGVDLFVRRYGSLVSASEQDQTVLREVLDASLRRIERDSAGLARRLFLWLEEPTEPRILAVDPAIAFGRPIVIGTRVPAEVLFERFRAGDSIRHLADEYAVAPDLIEDLLRKWFAPAAA